MREMTETKPLDPSDALKEGKGQANEPGRRKPGSATENLQPVAFLARSLSDENRLRILRFISGGKRSVTGIAEELKLSQPLVSHHLRELRRSFLVKIERNGPFVYYEMSDPRILNVIQSLSTVASDLLSEGKIF